MALDEKIMDLALRDDKFNNFEDALQYFSAIQNQQHAIITRNKKDFKNAELPILTAHEFLSQMQ